MATYSPEIAEWNRQAAQFLSLSPIEVVFHRHLFTPRLHKYQSDIRCEATKDKKLLYGLCSSI